MTLTLVCSTREDNPRLRRRSSRAGTGSVYYGHALKRILAPEPTPPIVGRIATSVWPRRVILVAICLVAAAALLAFADWFVLLPDGSQRVAVVALVIFPAVAVLFVWAWRRL